MQLLRGLWRSKQDLTEFGKAFRGEFTSVLSWDELDRFWDALRARKNDGWHLYAIGMARPERPASADEVERFLVAIDPLLRRDHREDYCGIVYADSKTDPSLIKIFDPDNLGVSCGFSDCPPLPGWVLSLLPPDTLTDRRVLPENRRRWWSGLGLETPLPAPPSHP